MSNVTSVWSMGCGAVKGGSTGMVVMLDFYGDTAYASLGRLKEERGREDEDRRMREYKSTVR